MELVGTITNVTGRTVNTKFGESTVYDVHFSDGNRYGTFKEPLAAEATRAKGLEGVTISVEKNGDFFNFAGVVSLNGNSPGKEGFDSNRIETSIPIENTTDDRQTKIMRQTAYKVAATLLSGSGANLEELRTLARLVEKEFNNPEGLPEWSE